MGKRQEEALKTRQRIIDALSELLIDKDLNDISIEEITTKANVAKGTFYTYFKRKEDVICSNALAKYESVTKASLDPSIDVYTNLCTYLKESAKIIDKYSLKTAQGWMQSVNLPLPGDQRGIEKYTFDRDNLNQMLKLAIDQHEISDKAPIDTITKLIMNGYYGAVSTWCITNGEVSLIKNIDDFCEYDLKMMIEQFKEE